MINLGVAYSLIEDHKNADFFLIRSNQVPPKNMVPLLALIENSLRAEDESAARNYTRVLFDYYERAQIRNQLISLSTDYLSPPLSPELISSIVGIDLKNQSTGIQNLQ